MSDLGRMQRSLHLGCHRSVHLDVKELSPLQDMAALAAFVAHADVYQDSCRGKVVNEMARENPVQLKSLESILHHRPGRFRGIASPPIRDTNPVAKFGTTMVGFDPKSHAAAQRITLTQDNAQAQAAAARELLLRAGDKVLSVGLSVGCGIRSVVAATSRAPMSGMSAGISERAWRRSVSRSVRNGVNSIGLL